MRPTAILETALYADDLDAMERFYEDVLGLEKIARVGSRHVFFRCGAGVLLIFNPAETSVSSDGQMLAVPPHGATGPGHLCFSASSEMQNRWEDRLRDAGIEIESRVTWPGGGKSIYFRDPAGNSIEFAEPAIWNNEG